LDFVVKVDCLRYLQYLADQIFMYCPGSIENVIKLTALLSSDQVLTEHLIKYY